MKQLWLPLKMPMPIRANTQYALVMKYMPENFTITRKVFQNISRDYPHFNERSGLFYTRALARDGHIQRRPCGRGYEIRKTPVGLQL